MMRSSLRLLFGTGVLALGATVASACATDQDEAGQTESDHTAGEYIQQNHLLYWTDSSFEEFRRVSEAGSWSSNPQPVGPEDVAQKWLQAWADRIDEIVRAKVEKDTGTALVAPKPTMHLLPSASISNAWVTAVPACTPWHVRAKNAAPPVEADASAPDPDAGTPESDAGRSEERRVGKECR